MVRPVDLQGSSAGLIDRDVVGSVEGADEYQGWDTTFMWWGRLICRLGGKEGMRKESTDGLQGCSSAGMDYWPQVTKLCLQ